ncbi:secreted RxLR effector protein 161-like [Cicer arietinum]|uniref:secreted RxLR effector protein 161-like n=1 Tax=Cicer arietinum TaxID=3827 RepID=UPI003CC649BE
MHEARKVTTPLGHNYKLSMQDSPMTNEERQRRSTIPYASGVGCIIYGMICSRPYLAYAVNVVSRFMTDPGALHWSALKWIMRYLNGSLTIDLKFKKTHHDKEPIKGYVDSDFAGNMDTRESISSYVFTLYGIAVSVEKIAIEDNPAVAFTKLLSQANFKHCLDIVGFDKE